MLVVLNRAYGGYVVPEEMEAILNVNDDNYDSIEIRTAPEFVQWVFDHEQETDLGIMEVPEGYTDYYINDYDGSESLIYVLDGKLRWARQVRG